MRAVHHLDMTTPAVRDARRRSTQTNLLQLVELVHVQAGLAVLQQRQEGARERLVLRVLAVLRHALFVCR